jgi:hypothetical protein
VADEGRVRQTFDSDTGRLVLVCDDTDTFERLREVLRREAGVGVMVNVPPAPVRSVSLELGEYVDPAPVGWGKKLAAAGCVVVLAAAGGVFLVGLFAVAAWLQG